MCLRAFSHAVSVFWSQLVDARGGDEHERTMEFGGGRLLYWKFLSLFAMEVRCLVSRISGFGHLLDAFVPVRSECLL